MNALWCYEVDAKTMCVYEDRVELDGPEGHFVLPLPRLERK